MNWMKIIIFVLLSITICIECEWVEIPQSVEKISQRKLSIENSMVPATGFVVKDLNKLKYDELADIIGPGFEDEFSKFLKRHSHEMSANANELDDGNQSIGLTTQNILYVDPWLKYDQEHTTAPFITSEHLWKDSAYKNVSVDHRKASTTTSTTIDDIENTTTTSKPHTTKRPPHVPNEAPVLDTDNKMQASAINASATKDTNSTKKLKSNRKTNRIKWIPYNPFSFNEILKFWRSIQSTFSMEASRGVTAKIQVLRKFKAELMHNIEERLKMLWPTQTEKKKRSKRGMMDGGGGGHDMDFPSAETALMTISILTFAVFLIKLVLQVIHTIKSKHFSYNGLQTMTSQSSEPPIKVIKGNRNARKLSFSIDDIHQMAATEKAIEKSAQNSR